MPLSNAHKNSQGFTLIELLIIVILVGVLSAISAPSFLGMLNRNKVNNALAQAQGALREAQREAIRKSKSCTVNLNAGTDSSTITGDCLVTGDRVLKEITMTVNPSDPLAKTSFNFDFKGESDVKDELGQPSLLTIFLSHSGSSEKKCLKMSSPLGLVRTGVANGDKCTIIQN